MWLKNYPLAIQQSKFSYVFYVAMWLKNYPLAIQQSKFSYVFYVAMWLKINDFQELVSFEKNLQALTKFL